MSTSSPQKPNKLPKEIRDKAYAFHELDAMFAEIYLSLDPRLLRYNNKRLLWITRTIKDFDRYRVPSIWPATHKAFARYEWLGSVYFRAEVGRATGATPPEVAAAVLGAAQAMVLEDERVGKVQVVQQCPSMTMLSPNIKPSI